MTPGTRRWRWIRAAGTIACALLVSVYIASAWWSFLWVNASPYFGLGIGGGVLICGRDGPPRPEFRINRAGPQWYWWFHNESSRRTFLLMIPLWAPFLALTLPTAYAWRRCRPLPGHCPSCGYNLAGNTTGICPECGSARAPS